MSPYAIAHHVERVVLPQTPGAGLFFCDGGMETVLIHEHGAELPELAAFVLLEHQAGVALLRRYYAEYVALARVHRAGLVLDTPTWRANRDRGRAVGRTPDQVVDANRRGVALLEHVRASAPDQTIVVNGALGPRGDGDVPGAKQSAEEAEAYHGEQVATLAGADVDMVTAYTLGYAAEAVGIARAARAHGVPVVISFTLETDGRLPDGQPLGEAIEQVDREADGAPSYYMVNCAHPTHFAGVLERGGAWVERIGGLRANASARSHEELDGACELDQGDPGEFGAQHAALRAVLPDLAVIGGCCGTDRRHVEAAFTAWRTAA